VIDLSETVSGMLKMLRRLIGESLELAWQPGKGAIMIKMDPSQINQILANLAVNARLATCGTGRLTIVTRTKIVDRAFCSLHLEARPGEYAVLAVSDNGCGMDKNTAEHIFEPFFTTRKMGTERAGLGTDYGIVKHNYCLSTSQRAGSGTTFDIYHPRCSTPIDTAPHTERGSRQKRLRNCAGG
jgi:signal transduction histidine kinase